MCGSRAQIFQDSIPGSLKFANNFDGKAYLNVLEGIDICYDLPSDSEKDFCFVVDEFSGLVHTVKLLCSRHLKYLWFGPRG